MKRCFLSVLVLPILLGSCALEHRHYRSGFYIDRNQKSDASANAQPHALPGKTARLDETALAVEPIRTPELSTPVAPVVEKPVVTPVPVAAAQVRHEDRRQFRLPLIRSRYDAASVKDTIYVRSSNGRHEMLKDAKTAQLLGILSLVGTFILGIGIILAPIAIGLGVRARNKILDSGDYYTGLREANSGITMGVIALVINILAIALILAVLVFSF